MQALLQVCGMQMMEKIQQLNFPQIKQNLITSSQNAAVHTVNSLPFLESKGSMVFEKW